MKKRTSIPFILFLIISALSAKEVYFPNTLRRDGIDPDKSSSKWCYARSRESENVVVFWEPGFGNDPSTASGNYRVDMDKLLQGAEKAYAFNVDSLKFVNKGSSVTDNYKLIIFLLYSTDWVANGSGYDDQVGSMQVSSAAAKSEPVIAHEMGHCFQYITGCDTEGGYRYGFGENGSGGNGFWEQCAQWQAYKVYPEEQFRVHHFDQYIKCNHLHILHEDPLYANYFLPDYWTIKHDITFTAKLWRESRYPEDPVETYKRLNSLNQDQFNDEMYEHAARLTTWDLPLIKSYGKNYIDKRDQVKMNLTPDNFWHIDHTVCIENYGYNSIKLNAPSRATDVTVHFKGCAGANGFRAIKTESGGWRYGFVALLENGERIYSDMGTANVEDGLNPEQSLTFSCPDNCSKLWLVVSGAPQEHWKHPWDEDYSNDEQWPYQVKFRNTNLLGQETEAQKPLVMNLPTHVNPTFLARTIYLPRNCKWQVTTLSGKKIKSGYGKVLDISEFSGGVYMLSYSGRHLRFMKR